jgi:hypothetical protein
MEHDPRAAKHGPSDCPRIAAALMDNEDPEWDPFDLE